MKLLKLRIKNKDLCIYSNGKLRLTTRDINDSIDERLNELDNSHIQETPEIKKSESSTKVSDKDNQ